MNKRLSVPSQQRRRQRCLGICHCFACKPYSGHDFSPACQVTLPCMTSDSRICPYSASMRPTHDIHTYFTVECQGKMIWYGSLRVRESRNQTRTREHCRVCLEEFRLTQQVLRTNTVLERYIRPVNHCVQFNEPSPSIIKNNRPRTTEVVTSHLNTGVGSSPETSCSLNTAQALDNVRCNNETWTNSCDRPVS
jgi:hypothetical protein